jgi:hypothetical protein
MCQRPEVGFPERGLLRSAFVEVDSIFFVSLPGGVPQRGDFDALDLLSVDGINLILTFQFISGIIFPTGVVESNAD